MAGGTQPRRSDIGGSRHQPTSGAHILSTTGPSGRRRGRWFRGAQPWARGHRPGEPVGTLRSGQGSGKARGTGLALRIIGLRSGTSRQAPPIDDDIPELQAGDADQPVSEGLVQGHHPRTESVTRGGGDRRGGPPERAGLGARGCVPGPSRWMGRGPGQCRRHPSFARSPPDPASRRRQTRPSGPGSASRSRVGRDRDDSPDLRGDERRRHTGAAGRNRDRMSSTHGATAPPTERAGTTDDPTFCRKESTFPVRPSPSSARWRTMRRQRHSKWCASTGSRPPRTSSRWHGSARSSSIGRCPTARPFVLLACIQDGGLLTRDARIHYEGLTRQAAFTALFGTDMSNVRLPDAQVVDVPPRHALRKRMERDRRRTQLHGSLVAQDLGDVGDTRYRRYDHVVTHDRDLVVEAARSLLRWIDRRQGGVGRGRSAESPHAEHRVDGNRNAKPPPHDPAHATGGGDPRLCVPPLAR